ncbi:RusA family crossover junction endodeoxyribonuclease [Bifidobacterium sp. ESL0784]|uniref:RusA family crossover junction endodeoxyribonuclease n=1 Tax=Bifidobacterium sp. ESL0784 TaxID=2983231 RepID=UPI0023F81750|nr:RusA family crossover junction endodeoxyribonuclease [Bifidobacterium sp. ESL0784]MDF7641750.1 RusA family crossover junction endodeoxyribonuclease [Bifidobacterium sp. ESL0784]
MISEFRFVVPGPPQSKGRPRVFRNPSGKGMHGVTPKKTKDAENRVYSTFITKYPDAQPFTGDVEVALAFWMPDRTGKDWDNLAKLATDALNGVAYVDDKQIMKATVRKILPDKRVQGKRGMRNRKAGDPLTHDGVPYQAHTHIYISEISQIGKEQWQ